MVIHGSTDAAFSQNLFYNVLIRNRNSSGLRILFDRGEPFIHPYKKYFERGRREVRGESEVYWPTQIESVEPGASAKTVELQVADLLAWTIHNRYSHANGDVDHRALEVQLLFLSRLFGAYLDSEKIFQTYVQRDTPEMKHSVPAAALLSHAEYLAGRSRGPDLSRL